MNEKNIINNLQNRDTEALKLVYERYKLPFIHWASSKFSMVDKAVIEDVYSEVVIDFYENIRKGKYKPTSALKIYLFTLGRNKLVNIIKKKMVHQAKENDLVVEAENRAIANPEMEHRISENSRIVRKMMDKLCDDCRKVLTLYYFEEFSMKEIAKEMGYKNSNVSKSKKNVCFKKLMKFVRESYTKTDFF